MNEVNRIRSDNNMNEAKTHQNSEEDLKVMQQIIEDLKKENLVLFSKIAKFSVDENKSKDVINNMTDWLGNLKLSKFLLKKNSKSKLWSTMVDALGYLIISPIFLTVGLVYLTASLKIDIVTIYLIQKENPNIVIKDGIYFFNPINI